MKQPLIILTGPTAVGKTELSISLAKAVGGEIISADSMQVYRGMDIGTAKIKPEEMEGIPHYLIDALSPREDFNIACFAAMAKGYIKEIYSRNKIPILVGGTGFYIQAVLYDIDFTKGKEDTHLRKELLELVKNEGEDALHKKLREIDALSAAAIHPNNVKRVIRAIEYFYQTGEKISHHNEAERQKESPYNAAYFVLTHDRQVLYDRINRRVDLMLEEGLVEEVKGLLESGCKKNMVSMQGLGYKEIIAYLEGELSLSEAVTLLKRDTRHFAKRQLTWFKRERDVIWLDKREYEDEAALLLKMLSVLREKKIISDSEGTR